MLLAKVCAPSHPHPAISPLSNRHYEHFFSLCLQQAVQRTRKPYPSSNCTKTTLCYRESFAFWSHLIKHHDIPVTSHHTQASSSTAPFSHMRTYQLIRSHLYQPVSQTLSGFSAFLTFHRRNYLKTSSPPSICGLDLTCVLQTLTL